MQEYADPVIDWLDAGRGILAHRLFRDVSGLSPYTVRVTLTFPQSCTQLPNGSYTKDLSVVDSDLSRVCLVDNSPISYRVNEGTGVLFLLEFVTYLLDSKRDPDRRLDP